MRTVTLAAALVTAALLSGCGAPSQPAPGSTAGPAASVAAGAATTTSRTSTAAPAPRPAHVVLVMLENHAFAEVVGNPSAPFLNSLAAGGATFTWFYAITHPSEPNYLALFSGSTHGLSSDACPVRYPSGNLARSLLDAHQTFIGYAEGLPRSGFTGCSSGDYARKHCPWTDFADLPSRVSQPMSSFPSSYAALPTVSFVIPDLQHDMHNGTVAQADSWLRQHLSGYARWARTHHSLLVVTADEDDGSAGNRIPLIIAGADVHRGRYASRYNLYSLLRTLEDLYRLPRLGASATAVPITGFWG